MFQEMNKSVLLSSSIMSLSQFQNYKTKSKAFICYFFSTLSLLMFLLKETWVINLMQRNSIWKRCKLCFKIATKSAKKKICKNQLSNQKIWAFSWKILQYLWSKEHRLSKLTTLISLNGLMQKRQRTKVLNNILI